MNTHEKTCNSDWDVVGVDDTNIMYACAHGLNIEPLPPKEA